MRNFIRHLSVWLFLFVVLFLWATVTGHVAATAITFAVIGMMIRPLMEESVKPVERAFDAIGVAMIFVLVLPFLMVYACLVAAVHGRAALGAGAWEAVSTRPPTDDDRGPRRVIVVTPAV